MLEEKINDLIKEWEYYAQLHLQLKQDLEKETGQENLVSKAYCDMLQACIAQLKRTVNSDT